MGRLICRTDGVVDTNWFFCLKAMNTLKVASESPGDYPSK